MKLLLFALGCACLTSFTTASTSVSNPSFLANDIRTSAQPTKITFGGTIAKFRSLYTWRFDISNLGIRHKWFTEGSEFDKVAETIQNQSAPLIRLSCGKHILLLYRLEVKLTGRNKKKIYYSIYFQRKVH